MPEHSTEQKVVVLAYHKIGQPPANGWDTWNYIAEDIFERQLEEVRDADYSVISIHDFMNGLEGKTELPERCALLTFDDGYKSMLTVAEPILNRYGFPSTIFVPTQHVASINSWDTDNEPEEPICTWDELFELELRGVSVQSHAHTHKTFGSLDLDTQIVEIARSKNALEEQLGTPCTALAFPYGDNGKLTTELELALSKMHFRTAFLYKGGPCTLPSETPFGLTRVPVGPDTSITRWLEVQNAR